MPFSIVMQGYPTENAPVPRVQGATVQGMFLHVLDEVDPAAARRLHDDSKYRPYTLSPLGIGEPSKHFDGFRLPRQYDLQAGTPCYVRICLLEDGLFPTFSRYFLDRPDPSFRLGGSEFKVTNVTVSQGAGGSPWSVYLPYERMIERASRSQRKMTLQFLTPTSFRRGKVDFLLPDPRLVFGSYRRRFEEFCGFDFPEDFDEQVEFHTGVSNLHRLETAEIRTKKVNLIGFTGTISYLIDKQAAPDLVFQMNLLADYAFFCGTGRKTTVGMGQTVRM